MKLPYLQIKKQFHAFQPKIFPLCFWLHLFFFFFSLLFLMSTILFIWKVYEMSTL